VTYHQKNPFSFLIFYLNKISFPLFLTSLYILVYLTILLEDKNTTLILD